MEKVLVVSASIMNAYLKKNGFISESTNDILNVIEKNHLYIDRDYAEHAKEYKQIIPYVILSDGKRIFLTQRLKAQTEKRLHGKYSIGLGGHINPSEENSEDVILEGMKRELFEEVGLTNIITHECVGIINDLSTEVSNFHIGIVFYLCVSPDIHIKEVEKMTGKWATDDEIRKVYEYLESWSQIVWENKQKWKN